jgi:hypothetical protein
VVVVVEVDVAVVMDVVVVVIVEVDVAMVVVGVIVVFKAVVCSWV